MIVSKKVSFDAAHHLPNYEGSCSKVHGHHWEVEVGVKGDLDGKAGMVVDFKWLKEALDTEVVKKFDHEDLNSLGFMPNPTAENLAAYIFNAMMFRWIQSPAEPVQVEYVRVWETEDSMAEYNIEDFKKQQRE